MKMALSIAMLSLVTKLSGNLLADAVAGWLLS